MTIKAAWLLAALGCCWGQDWNAIKELKYRSVGFNRGGRSVAVTGVASQPNTFYFGATGGGVFKSTDAGASWMPVSDGQMKTGSVGAVAVAESDPNVVYAGMGEGCIRGNVSHGDGVYKSTDAGKTWKKMGLDDTYHIGQVRIHPKNADVVYVAALGHTFGANEQRGVFRSTDGGKNWKQVLTKGPKAGAIDLAFEPGNPQVLYAAFWDVKRSPWSFESGGPGSGFYKTTDGGDTWTEITRNAGLPKGVVGRIGIAPFSGDRVWAIIEAEDGGVFRSNDGGKTWTRVNEDRRLRQRAWYYTHIYADPVRADTLYVLNTGFYRSDDSGKTFTPIRTPHGDNHDLWIAPNDPQRMIESNDGGANVSVNGGRTWSPQNQQPTAQFYRVSMDEDFPYHIYGAQQDNSTVRVSSRNAEDWYDVGGGESGWIAPDPRNSDVVYAGSYDGLLTRYEHRTGQLRNIAVWPDNPMGAGAEAMKYRFQWNFPILFSLHDPKRLYAGGNILFRTTNEGQSWEAMSPDLTRNDKSKQAPTGGPITKDNTSIEYYDTIFTVAESPVRKGVIWTGSDDGLVQVTQDDGKTWTNVTPKGLPDWIQINSIEASPHDAGTAYFAATLYKLDDFRPFLYKTTNYGKSWSPIVNGIPERAFARVIREDPNRRGLLVAGTETGMFVSFNDGVKWQSLQLNLPVVPITDLAFHKRDDELVVATQGRAFWILDELPLLSDLTRRTGTQLFAPKAAYRSRTGLMPVYFWLNEKPKSDVGLEFLDSDGKTIKKFSSKVPDVKPEAAGFTPEEDDFPRGPVGSAKVPVEVGLNHFDWDMRYEDAVKFPGLIMWAGNVRGPMVAPGSYQVKMTVDGKTETQRFTIQKDPRLSTTPEDYAKQLTLQLQIRDKLSAANQAVVQIRQIRGQLERYYGTSVDAEAHALAAKLTSVEEALYQTKNRSSQDPLNFPIRLNNKIAALGGAVGSSDNAPTSQASQVYEDLASQINAEVRKLGVLEGNDVAAFNKLVRERNVPAVVVKGNL